MSPSAERSGRCHMSPEGTCQAPMPVPRGTGLVEVLAGVTQRWGDGGGPEGLGVCCPLQSLQWVPRTVPSPGTPQTPLRPTTPARRGGGGYRVTAVTPRGATLAPSLLPAVPGVPGQPWGPSPPRGTPLRATPSTGSRGAPSARPPRGGWGGRQALISAGVN